MTLQKDSDERLVTCMCGTLPAKIVLMLGKWAVHADDLDGADNQYEGE